MNLFREIEGLKSENMTSAILRLLLLRSMDFRSEFVGLISSRCLLGPVHAKNRFSCELERGTGAKGKEKGRIDLFLETDSAVIGIENKLDAHFMTNQPGKYLDDVVEHAGHLSKALGRQALRPVIAVLAPAGRKAEILAHLRKQDSPDSFLYISWEETLAILQRIESRLDRLTAAIAESLADYLEESLLFIPRFAELYPHYRNRFEHGGTDVQFQLVQTIFWALFKAPDRRYGSTGGSGGYTVIKQDGDFLWFGFVESSQIGRQPDGHSGHAAELVVVTTLPVKLSSPSFTPAPVDLVWGFPNNKTWIINFDESWSDSETWRRELTPLLDVFSLKLPKAG